MSGMSKQIAFAKKYQVNLDTFYGTATGMHYSMV